MSVTGHQRSNGVKNADLIVDLPTEKTLDMQWNFFKDSLTFEWKTFDIKKKTIHHLFQ